MAKKRYNAEAFIHKLREADVLIGLGKTVREVCMVPGVTDKTCYPWRELYGGMRVGQAKRLKELELENDRLKRAVRDYLLLFMLSICQPLQIRSKHDHPSFSSIPRSGVSVIDRCLSVSFVM